MLSCLYVVDQFVKVRDGSLDHLRIDIDAKKALRLVNWGNLKSDATNMTSYIEHSFAHKQFRCLAPLLLKLPEARCKELESWVLPAEAHLSLLVGKRAQFVAQDLWFGAFYQSIALELSWSNSREKISLVWRQRLKVFLCLMYYQLV